MNKGGTGVRLTLALALAFAFVSIAQAENFVFESSTARLVIGTDGTAVSLVEKQNEKEQLSPGGGLPFAVVRKNGQLVSASGIERRGALFHVTFGTSGVTADYRITASPEYIVVELAAVQGDGIQELRLVSLSTHLTNAGAFLQVQWDDEFTLCLMGLSQQVNSIVAGRMTWASVYPEFSMVGQRVAIIAVPTQQFLNVVQKVEHDFQLPSPTIGGVWAKLSPDVRTSYLFTDLTEANADQTIRYAKMAGMRYILIYADTWSATEGSYPINLKSYPHGEDGLKSVIAKCHAAGLKVGMHMMTSLIGKDDAMVRPKPDPGLLKDGEATLAADVSEQATELTATSASDPSKFSTNAGDFGTSTDVLVDNEIIHYSRISDGKFLQCVRGFAGTTRAAHMAGAKIQHLVQQDNRYLADLRSPLADVLADRVAGLINRDGFDMIYFDAGELNKVEGPYWYWVGVQQGKIWQRSKRDLLMQGSGATNWTWHLFARGTCEDYAAVAVKQYLDLEKIDVALRAYRNSFVPAELGWVGFLSDTPDHPATTPDQVEYYAVRMLALDLPVSLETNLSALKANGRSEEMLRLMGEYEQLRLSGAVSKPVRDQLTKGEWHMTRPGEFHPVSYDAQGMAVPGEIQTRNQFADQPLKFRLQVTSNLAASGDPGNILLLRSQSPIEVRPPDAHDAMPGALAQRIDLINAAPSGGSVPANGRAPGRALDLTTHRALAVQLEVDGAAPAANQSPVLNVQLETAGKTLRDYYIDLNFQGSKTVILPEPGTDRMLANFRSDAKNYPFKLAMYSFDYRNVVALNLRWMRYAKGSGVRCRIHSVEAVDERSSVLKDFEIFAGQASITIPGEMKTGDYAEYWADGPIRIFDRNGILLRTVPANGAPVLRAAENKLTVRASGSGTAKLTVISLGK
jgi:hypothetical protein